MTRFRKTVAASLAALTIGGTVLATSASPAAAWGYGYGGWHGGWGGWHGGWGGPGLAAGVLGGLAVGGIAAAAAAPYGYGYGYGCVATQPVYDAWGYVHSRRVRVPC
jgi:hypothetical protein